MTELRFSYTLEKLNIADLLREKKKVIVGFSGGADSSCLLVLMSRWCKENGVKIYAAHVNHMIRGNEADRDEQFCRERAKKLGIPIYVKKADVPAVARERGVGLEEAARDVRYEFFSEISTELTGKADGAIIATAHNASDNLETVLMNLMRGTGLHGMSGIQPIRDGRIIRPLIYDSGENIREWCRENGVDFVLDSTNAETDCTRNILRNKVVPIFKEMFPSPEESVARMTELLRADDSYLTGLAFDIVGNQSGVDRKTLVSLDKAVSSRVLIMLYDKVSSENGTLSKDHIEKILSIAEEKSGYSSLSLPGNVTAHIDRDKVYLTENCIPGKRSENSTVFEYTGGEATFENEIYKIIFSDIPLNVEDITSGKENIYNLSILREFDCDKIKKKVYLKYKTDGDSYVFGGHTHKVKKLFTDRKLSFVEKRLTPLVCDGNGILWIPGYRTRDGIREEGHKKIYILALKKNVHNGGNN